MLFFRLPFQDKIFTTSENSNNVFVNFISFDDSKKIGFKGNIKEISKEDFLKTKPALSKFNFQNHIETKEEYLQKIEKTIDFIKENNLGKLVVARKKFVDIQNINIPKTFLNLCENYPSAFVYFFNENGENWIGAFAEILGKFNKKTSEFETMSLAGTLPLNETWSEKEKSEQQCVTDYILDVLKKYDLKPELSETFDHISGNIKHLRADFKVKMNAEYFDDLISELHPTPAVCGFPKELCKKAISELENFDREFYCGYSRIETEEGIYCFVNLRCGKIYENRAELFVGGGITAQSSPEKEWRETELKSEALLKNFRY
ncbi:MAG: chorismate-binding protein [Flavobacteriaceae bacterium]|jgi:isochorismate synthase|nr:chorismate-binding protein [Flavobacteriaceae bacterium]